MYRLRKKGANLTRTEKGEICPTCMGIVKLLQSKPDALQKLSRMAGISEVSTMPSPQEEQELPEVLDGVPAPKQPTGTETPGMSQSARLTATP